MLDIFDNGSACFSGHRVLGGVPLDMLVSAIERRLRELYAGGTSHFYAGGALGFDMLASVTLLNLKNELSDLSLTVVYPCRNHTRGWHSADIELLGRIEARADEVVCLSDTYYTGCMNARNRYMVDRSDICVCYLTQSTGGTAFTVGCARKRGIQVINLAKELIVP
jgi:Uncharacterized protein conserved in bacteria